MSSTADIRYRSVATVAMVFAVLLAALIYLPGLQSGFYLDDYYNLHLLSAVDTDGVLAFVAGGMAGPLGRPLSYLSFALQAASWPGNPVAFKFVNLLLHLANGVLVYLLSRALAPRLGLSHMAGDFFCVFSAGLWLLHPMHLSTVLYIVQRMTQLSAAFVLLGVLGYLVGRRLAEAGQMRRGYITMSLSVILGTLAAALCKENGILLPVLILVLDQTLVGTDREPPGYRRWRWVCLGLPTVMIGAWLVWQAIAFPDAFHWRPYSMYQKALTEAPVLLTYLWNLIVPRPSAYGLFYDDFPVSRSLLEPLITLPAVAMVALLAGAAVLGRRRQPMLAFGLLWFFAGHLLESTHLNLEIFFEHRNYLPSVGLLMLIPWSLLQLESRLPSFRPAAVALCLYAALVAWVSVQNTLLWRQPVLFAQEMVRSHPQSRWALTQLGTRYISTGESEKAAAFYRDLAARFPSAILPWLRLAAIAACFNNEPVPATVWSKLEQMAVATDGAGFDFLAELDTHVLVMARGECPNLDSQRLSRVVDGLAVNPHFVRERPVLYQLSSSLRILLGDFPGALEQQRRAKESGPNLNRHWQYIALLARLGNYQVAAAEIVQFKTALDRKPLTWFAYRDKLAALEQQMEMDTARSKR